MKRGVRIYGWLIQQILDEGFAVFICDLLRRGFDEGLLELFRIEPIAEAPCPSNCRKAMRLYDLEQILKAERDPQFWAVPKVDIEPHIYTIKGELAS